MSSIRTDKVVTGWKDTFKRHLITKVSDLNDLFLRHRGESFGFDTETTGLDHETLEIVGFSVCFDLDAAYYVPLAHRFGSNIDDRDAALKSLFTALYEAKVVLVYNWWYDGRVVSKYGCDRNKVKFLDVMQLVWNTDTNVSMPSLKDSAERFLGIKSQTYEELVGGKDGSYENLAPEDCLDYAACDAYFTLALAKTLRQFYIDNRFIVDLDCGFQKAMMDLADTPLRIDLAAAEKMLVDSELELKRLEGEIQTAFNRVFLVSSPIQLGRVLEENGLDTGVRTEKSGQMSTGIDELEPLKSKHPAIGMLIQYKELDKVVGSYIQPLVDHYRKDLDGLRVNYYLTKAPTARLSSGTGADKQKYFAKINIQSQPKGSGTLFRADFTSLEDPEALFGWRFIPDPNGTFEGQDLKLNPRACYLPRRGHYLLDIDYDAEEVVVAGNLSGDPVYLEPLSRGEDIHKSTAIRMWGEENYNKEKRKLAKIAQFGLVYGGTGYTLRKSAPEKSDAERDEIAERFWSAHSVLKSYQTAMQAQAKRAGFFKTRMGRIRRVDFWYNSPDRRERSFADRTVSNGVVQGLCGDIIRFAILRVWNDVITNPKWFNKHVFWVCTVHDEIALSVDKSPDLFTEISDAVVHRMTDFPFLQFKVPLTVSPSVGLSWGGVFEFHHVNGVWSPGKAPRQG